VELDEAIAAHSAWKAKLKTYLRKPDKSLIADDVAKDNQCILGKWLYADGAKYFAFPEFKELREEHANFHRAAADLIKRADSGESVGEEAALGANSAFSTLSSRLVQLIVKLKQKVH
jgi:Chemoreceptor zinc-binding domain